MYPVLAAGTMAPNLSAVSAGPLTIDTHCHLFNGTDIQLKNFLLYTHQGVSPRLVNLARNLEKKFGFTGEDEWVVLDILARHMHCPTASDSPLDATATVTQPPLGPPDTQPKSARTQINDIRAAAFHRAQKSISTAMEDNPPTSPKEQQTDDDVKQLLQVQSHEEFRKKIEATTPTPSPGLPVAPGKSSHKHVATCEDPRNLGGELETVVDYFLPRIVLAQLYLDTFCPSAGRNVDLIFAAMVDYDWWLANGDSAETSLQEQVKVMEQISILSGGRIHGLAPFCPLREVAHRAGQGKSSTNWSSLEFVKDAVRNRGCLGVKLYPPMGFAAYGNTQLDDPTAPPWDPVELTQCGDPVAHPHPEFWSRNVYLPHWARQPLIHYPFDDSDQRLGVRLDAALDDLYTWCQAEGVPILAHTNTTNGVDCVYEKLAQASYWRQAFDRYPNLRVSFGHMGGFDDALGEKISVPATSLAFIDLMGDDKAPPQDPPTTFPHAYADSAYDAILLACRNRFVERLDLAYQATHPFGSHFLYGTDWSLTVHVGHNQHYLKYYEQLMKQLDASYPGPGKKPSEAFFGWNAVEYAGLRTGSPTRQRLEAFYTRYRIQKPGWAAKVDAG